MKHSMMILVYPEQVIEFLKATYNVTDLDGSSIPLTEESIKHDIDFATAILNPEDGRHYFNKIVYYDDDDLDDRGKDIVIEIDNDSFTVEHNGNTNLYDLDVSRYLDRHTAITVIDRKGTPRIVVE